MRPTAAAPGHFGGACWPVSESSSTAVAHQWRSIPPFSLQLIFVVARYFALTARGTPAESAEEEGEGGRKTF